MISFFKLVSILLFSLLVSPLYAASFVCHKATTETEKVIYTDQSVGTIKVWTMVKLLTENTNRRMTHDRQN